MGSEHRAWHRPTVRPGTQEPLMMEAPAPCRYTPTSRCPSPPSNPSCVGGRGRRSSVTHAAPGRPAYPTPVCPVPIWASSGWDSQGGSTLGPKGVGEGQAQADKESGRGGHSARPEETVAQCPASPGRTVGSCSQTAPHGGNPNSISAPLTPQRREKPQSRGSLPAGVTQHLSHSGNIPGCPPGPAQQETPKGASGSKARIAGKANANGGDPTQQGGTNHTAPQGAAP